MTHEKSFKFAPQQHTDDNIIRFDLDADTKIITKEGILNHAMLHALVQRFEMYHLEQGPDLGHIQEFLGLERSKTTEIYMHVKNSGFMKFKNPLDDLFEDDS